MKLYQKLLACGLVGASSYLSGCCENQKTPDKEKPTPPIVKTEEKPVLPVVKDKIDLRLDSNGTRVSGTLKSADVAYYVSDDEVWLRLGNKLGNNRSRKAVIVDGGRHGAIDGSLNYFCLMDPPFEEQFYFKDNGDNVYNKWNGFSKEDVKKLRQWGNEKLYEVHEICREKFGDKLKIPHKERKKQEEQLVTEEKPKKPSWPVYDSELGQFIKREKGISESVLNSLDSLVYRTEKKLDYYQIVENQEQTLEFILFKANIYGEISRKMVFFTMAENLKLVEAIDKKDNVKEEYKPLKELLTKCNEVYNNTKGDNLERTIKLCNIISEYIKPGEVTSDSVSIVDLVNGKLCDCNDVSPAYFALLNYYHVDCYVIHGRVKDDEGESLHAWLFVETKEHSFELDPTWYEHFTPLDTRNKEIKDISTLKEKHMRYK